MKISQIREKFKGSHPNKLLIIRKGIFWVLLEEEAYCMAKYFSMKLTQLDKTHIKVGFPDSSLPVRTKKLSEKKIGYVLIDRKEDGDYQVSKAEEGDYISKLLPVNVEDYTLTKERILGLAKLGLQEKQTENFLLKDKLEDIYLLLSQWLMRLPRKERQYFRSKIESLFMDTLEDVYMYMYNLGDRQNYIENIYKRTLVMREFTRFLYKGTHLMKDIFYLDIGERRVEVLKIAKTLRNKYTA